MNKWFVFFPESSIRTRVTFERGINDLGGRSILFDSAALKKKEAHIDVIGYLDNWVDCIIVRFSDMDSIQRIGSYSKCPVINGLSDKNHPCEVIADLYSLYKKDYELELEYKNEYPVELINLFEKGNINFIKGKNKRFVERLTEKIKKQ